MLVKHVRQYLKDFGDDDQVLITSTPEDISLEVLNVFKNMYTGNLEIQVAQNDE